MIIKGIFFATLLATSFVFAQNDSDILEASDLQGDGAAKIKVEEKATDKKDKEKSGKNIEKIEVTGSYVRRIDVEGPTPIVSIDKEDFEVAGLNTVSDMMRENPMFSGVSDNGNRDGFFNFRGQHAGSTLVLINGIRVPKLGGSDRGFYSGVENIPTNIIDRVEILKDGSSALYGSDAMAGVMNFITKKDYDGAEYSARVNVPEIGQGLEQNHNISFGKSYSRGNWLLSTQYVESRGYTGKDVGNYYPGDGTFGSTSKKTFTGLTQNADGSYERIKDGTRVYRGTCSAKNEDDCPESDLRGFDFIREPKENIGTLLTGRYDITSDVSVAMVGIYNRRKRRDIGLPMYANFDRQNGQTPFEISNFKSAAFKQNAGAAPYGELVVQPVDEVGARDIEVLQNSYSLQSKVEGYFLDTWQWNAVGSYAYSLEERDHRNGLIDMDIASNIMQNSDTWSLGGRNVGSFGPANVQGTEAYEANMTTARLLTTGELFDMNDVYGTGGAVSMAIGVEGQWERTADLHDTRLINTNTNVNFFPNQEGIRTVNSAFAEIVAYPLNALEFQMAGRSDTYSDFGSTFNPKFSLGYRPSNKVLFRTSWGTNFNAPSVRNMIQREEVSYESNTRFCKPGEDSCDKRTVPFVRYRDPTLRPEKGVNYNIGTVIQPNKNWTFTIDQWNFEGEGMLARRSGSNYSSLLKAFDGDEQRLQNEAGVTLIRDANGNVISARAPMVRNMGTRIIRGIDLNIAFQSPVRILGVVVNGGMTFDHTHMLERKTKYTSTSDFRNYQDMEWKNTLAFTASTSAHAYRLAARTLAGDTGEFSQTRTSTEYDFNYSYQIPWWTASVSIGAKNLLNSRPPVDRTGNIVDFNDGFNASQFQALGRRYYVGYSHSF